MISINKVPITSIVLCVVSLCGVLKIKHCFRFTFTLTKMPRVMIKGGVWRNTEDEIMKAAVMK